MASLGQPANTFDSYDAIGNREDLADVIWNISPTECPFQMMVGRGRASARLHEWQTDQLATAAANSQIEGDDYSGDAIVATVRLGNYTNISSKVIVIAGTQEVVDKAGRKSELAYQIAKNGQELKRDMEVTLTGNNLAVVGNATTARELHGLEGWYGSQAVAPPADNTSRGAGGSDGGISTGVVPDSAATDGTQRALSEALLKDVIQAVWTNGGDGECVMVGPFNKSVISEFTGNSTRENMAATKKLFAAIDWYVSDFGTHQIVPNRFSRERTVHVLTKRLWSVDYLRAFRIVPLAKTGDNDKRLLLSEYSLRSSNETGSGVVADVNTS